MPLKIVINDITNMETDAIVNTTNSAPVVGVGVDSEIHQKASKKLLEERKKIGNIEVGSAAITKGYDLKAKYVIHTVCPTYNPDDNQTIELLKKCYYSCLDLAAQYDCESISFPLLASGNKGFPSELALNIANEVFKDYLENHELDIYLVVYNREAISISKKLSDNVKRYIQENYIKEKPTYSSIGNNRDYRFSFITVDKDFKVQTDTFSQSLIKIIDQKGLKDPEVYKKANMDRRLFNKIKNDKDYKPSKETALALCIALELDKNQTNELLEKAGYTLSRSIIRDLIVQYYIEEKNYDILEINDTLFHKNQPLL